MRKLSKIPMTLKQPYRRLCAFPLTLLSLIAFITFPIEGLTQEPEPLPSESGLSQTDLSQRLDRLLGRLRSLSDVEYLGERVTGDKEEVAEIASSLRELRSLSKAELRQFADELTADRKHELIGFLSMLLGRENLRLPSGWERLESDDASWTTTGTVSAEYDGHQASGTLLELSDGQVASLEFHGSRIAVFGSTGPYLSGEAEIRLDGEIVAKRVEWDILVADHQAVWVSDQLTSEKHTLEIRTVSGDIGIDYVAISTDGNKPASLPRIDQRALPAAFAEGEPKPLGMPLSIESGDTEYQLDVLVDGEMQRRKYIVHLPPKAAEHMPVLLVLHGVDGTAAGMRDWTKLNAKADEAGFIAVYLESPSMWLGGNDHRYVLAVLDELARKYKPDRGRIYSTGFSAGGFMSHSLAMLHPDRIAAVASVAGGIPLHFYPFPKETPHSIATLDIHNRRDQVVRYSEVTTMFWRKFHGIATGPTEAESKTTNESPAVRRSWKHNGIEVAELIYDHESGNGHGWPTEASEGFSANSVIWEFVSTYCRGH